MENMIQFVANYGDWQAIKKMKVEEGTDPKQIMEFIASLGFSFDRKVEENLRKIVDLDRVDKAVEEEVEKGKSAESIAKALSAVSGRAVNGVIKEITEKPGLQKNEIKELQQFCKAYAMKKALKALGLMADYSEVDVPGMKRLKKRKV
jgi:hypothetical protein